jgi:hypothetical protein
VTTCLIEHKKPYLLAKVPVFVNLAFNVNIEYLSLARMNMEGETLGTLSRVLSMINAPNHLHHVALRMDPVYGYIRQVDQAAWEEVFRVLAGPHFRCLRVLSINIGPGFHNEQTVEISQNMVAAYPSLATRGARVSLCNMIGHQCIFCSA